MGVIYDSRECYVSDNLKLRETCFHLAVTDSKCMFGRHNALTLSQQFVTRDILPIISYKRWMRLITPSCPQRLPQYEFLYASAPGTMPPTYMN